MISVAEFSVFSKMSTVVFIFKRNYECCHHVGPDCRGPAACLPRQRGASWRWSGEEIKRESWQMKSNKDAP